MIFLLNKVSRSLLLLSRTHFSGVTRTSVLSSCVCVGSPSVGRERNVLILSIYCFVLVCLSIVLLLWEQYLIHIYIDALLNVSSWNLYVLMVSRISTNKTHFQSNMQVIHARIILEVQLKKLNLELFKKGISKQPYFFTYEYLSLRCYSPKNLVVCLQREHCYQEVC